MILARRQVKEGERFPRFYGLAYCRFEYADSICYLIPFNIIVRLVRRAWLWLKAGGWDAGKMADLECLLAAEKLYSGRITEECNELRLSMTSMRLELVTAIREVNVTKEAGAKLLVRMNAHRKAKKEGE